MKGKWIYFNNAMKSDECVSFGDKIFSVNETVKDYLLRKCRTEVERNKIRLFLKIVNEKKDRYHPALNGNYTQTIPINLRIRLNKAIKYDFDLNVLLSNHFTLRLLSRFSDKSIVEIMLDVHRALERTNVMTINENIFKLFGISYAVIYSNINNILLTIIDREIKDMVKLYRSRRNNGYNRLKGDYNNVRKKSKVKCKKDISKRKSSFYTGNTF